MPDISEAEKCRSRREIAMSNATRNSNGIKKLITEKGSESKVR